MWILMSRSTSSTQTGSLLCLPPSCQRPSRISASSTCESSKHFQSPPGRQASAALTAKLEDESFFAPAAASDDDWAKLTVSALIDAGDLLLFQDGLTEELI